MKFANNPLFLNTVLLGGTSEEKISAAAGAGFQQIELWRQDVEKAQGDVRRLTQFIHAQGLALTDYQVLLDFTGAPDVKRAEKRSEALTLLDTAAALDASTLLVPASTDPACIAQREEEDLLWLTQEAKARGLRVAFEAMAWSTHINTLP
uniref:sugar phosphate isomerase/epimerase family protein n=1 Tax=Erwinia oleae TaxID=796334 RepID=UPI000551F78C